MRKPSYFERTLDSRPLPPVLLRSSDTFYAFEAIGEVEGELGLILWQSLRNVKLWTESCATSCNLFSHEAFARRRDALATLVLAPELHGPLYVVAELLAHPNCVDHSRLTDACFRIAKWAESRGAVVTALEFMQAGALASSDLAQPAYLFAKAARKHAEYAVAESWFARAIHLARRRGDWKVYALAWSGLGNLHVLRGNFPAAKRAHLRVYRVAKRQGLPEIQGGALHDLFGIAVETGAPDVERLALAALRAYGWRSVKLPALAHDVAYLWVLRGEFARALPVAEALVSHFDCPAERLQALGDVARAAGGVGDAARFLSAFDEMSQLKLNPETEAAHARAFLDAANGAASLGQPELAQKIASHALKVARQRGEGKIILAAESLIASAEMPQSTQTNRCVLGAPIENTLAGQLIDALSRQHAASCPIR